MKEDSSAWTLYWSGNTPHSCIASQNDDDTAAINAIWADFAASLELGCEILDLATGNGAVPAAMLHEHAGHAITAVDRAHIDPLKFLQAPGPLQQVRFIGEVDVRKLPFTDNSYDALSSQFGIEYANLAGVAAEVSRVLKPGGRFLFLIHHCDSAIVSPNERLIEELETCLREGGLIDSLRAFTNGTNSAVELDEAGKRYLQTPVRKTKQISGQVFEAIGTIIQVAEFNTIEALAHSQAMITRLEGECTRLTQMKQASLDQAGICRFRQQLQDRGLKVNEPEKFTVGVKDDAALVGWLLAGSRPRKYPL